jgi:hypothetical protein
MGCTAADNLFMNLHLAGPDHDEPVSYEDLAATLWAHTAEPVVEADDDVPVARGNDSFGF